MDHVNKFLFLLNIIIYIIVSCFLISNTTRILGNDNNVGQNTLYYIGFLFGLVNGSTRFIWGILMDKFGFKCLMIIITIIELGLSFSIYHLARYPIIFIIENLLVAFCLSGTFTTITPLFNKVFGSELATEIYGLTGFFIGVASFIGPLLTNLIVKDQKDYLIVYSIGGGICLMKFFAIICFKENEVYHFKNKNKEINKSEDINKNEEIFKNEEKYDDEENNNFNNNNTDEETDENL